MKRNVSSLAACCFLQSLLLKSACYGPCSSKKKAYQLAVFCPVEQSLPINAYSSFDVRSFRASQPRNGRAQWETFLQWHNQAVGILLGTTNQPLHHAFNTICGSESKMEASPPLCSGCCKWLWPFGECFTQALRHLKNIALCPLWKCHCNQRSVES